PAPAPDLQQLNYLTSQVEWFYGEMFIGMTVLYAFIAAIFGYFIPQQNLKVLHKKVDVAKRKFQAEITQQKQSLGDLGAKLTEQACLTEKKLHSVDARILILDARGCSDFSAILKLVLAAEEFLKAEDYDGVCNSLAPLTKDTMSRRIDGAHKDQDAATVLDYLENLERHVQNLPPQINSRDTILGRIREVRNVYKKILDP
ncbi:MAG: hypothetical protein ACP5QA_15630, partial [Phycisphaerae bacterium]